MNRRDTEAQRVNRLTRAIIGCAIDVHRALGPGLLESAYEECLCQELAEAGLSFARQVRLPVTYKSVKLDCGYRMDLVVEGIVVVELKTVEQLAPVHEAQLLTYLRIYGRPAGLVINFNVARLVDGVRRVVNNLAEASAPPRLCDSDDPAAICVIPARMAATRLPGKPLLEIGGKPMIQHVWERATRAASVGRVIVATPDPEVYDTVLGFGGEAMMTRADHRSGTDRVAEVATRVEGEVFVNVQGDEPLIDPSSIDLAVSPLRAEPELAMASLMCPCPADDLDSPACVKVVVDRQGNALYFSRARIPHVRDAAALGDSAPTVMQHVGLYAYRRAFLLAFSTLSRGALELAESLEQLRVLENGFAIRMSRIEAAPISVDTPEDLERVRALIMRQ